jgi:hypothetical protein
VGVTIQSPGSGVVSASVAALALPESRAGGSR